MGWIVNLWQDIKKSFSVSCVKVESYIKKASTLRVFIEINKEFKT